MFKKTEFFQFIGCDNQTFAVQIDDITCIERFNDSPFAIVNWSVNGAYVYSRMIKAESYQAFINAHCSSKVD